MHFDSLIEFNIKKKKILTFPLQQIVKGKMVF